MLIIKNIIHENKQLLFLNVQSNTIKHLFMIILTKNKRIEKMILFLF